MLTIFMIDSGQVSINFLAIWLWIIMSPRRKLSILDRGRALAWLNDGERNCCQMIETNLPFSKLPMDFVVSIFQRSVHVAYFIRD